MKKSKLVYNWVFILRKAWSVRWAVVSGLFSGLAAVLPYFDTSMGRAAFVLLTIVVSLIAAVSSLMCVVARVTYQSDMHE